MRKKQQQKQRWKTETEKQKTKSKRNAAKQGSSGITSYRFGPSSRRVGSLGLAIVLGLLV